MIAKDLKHIRPYIVDYITINAKSLKVETRAIDDLLGLDSVWERGRGRAPFDASFTTTGITAFYRRSDDYGVLVEVSGTGIPRIKRGRLLDLLGLYYQDITRIDIALDYPEGITPKDIVGDAKINGMYDTKSGITYYLGSPKSDVMLRVYMYHPPHPRANVTRAEFVFRRYASKTIALAVASGDGDGLKATIEKFAKRKGIDMGLGDATLALVLGKPKDAPTMAGRVVWLKTQVRPAIADMIDAGIDTMTILEYLGLVKK